MSSGDTFLLPRAKLRDVLRGRARLVGSRFDVEKPRGFLSPAETRLRMGIPYDDPRAVERSYLVRRRWCADLGVLAKAALACALAPSVSAKVLRKPFIVSAAVDNLTIAEALESILRAPAEGRARLIFFVHAHALNLARFQPGFARILEDADALLPDGIGIRLAARFLGVGMRHNLNGTDLFPILCRAAAGRLIPIVMIGGAPGVAAECARRMKAETPGLDVAFTTPGFFDSEPAAREVAARVGALGRTVVLVGMGSPRQERWAWEYLRDCREAAVLTVGGLFDFYSGRVRRAPVGWREMGLEWAYRLLQEPRRLARRYLVGNPLFLALALAQRLRGREP